jgi:hypothetical protein
MVLEVKVVHLLGEVASLKVLHNQSGIVLLSLLTLGNPG